MTPSWFESLFGPPIFPIRIGAFSPLAFMLLPIPLLFLRRRGKSAGYLLSFSGFFLYAWAVLAYTIFDQLPASSDQLEMIRGRSWAENIHLMPRFLSGDIALGSEQVYGNFLLGVPFGFALPFVATSTHRRVVLLGFGFAAGIELAQLLIGLLLLQGPYRVIDIDDVWLVFVGALSGYGALRVAALIYRRIGWEGGARLPVWSHLHGVLLHVASGRVSPGVPASRTYEG